jgi:hypothetical protein
MDNYEDLTVNIRKAFRLLFSFTSSFNGIIKFIRDNFNLTYLGDKITNADIVGRSPANSIKSNLEKSLWAWFPLYYRAYDFQSLGKPAFSFSIILQCDTGRWDNVNDINDIKREKLDEVAVDEYGKPETAKTNIIFGLCEGKGIDIAKRFDDFAWSEDCKDGRRLTKDSEKCFFVPVSDKSDKNIFFKLYKLSDFRDQETAKQSLQEFVAYLKKRGIDKFEFVEE